MPPFALRLLLPLWIALRIGAAAQPASPDPLFAEVGALTADLAKISGLAPLHHVEYSRLAKQQVHELFDELLKQNVKPEEIRSEEAVLKKFGFVPQDFDLKKTTIDLLSEQAVAFYDYRKQKLFIIDSTPGFAQRSALAHELAHALADQHFHLRKFVEHVNQKDDSAMARLAVMEGQATWLMAEQLAQGMGQSIKDSPSLLKMLGQAAEISGQQYPVFQHAPLYLRATLLFPYVQGLMFQNAVVVKMGKAGFSEIFRHPPISSQQILHPDLYFAGIRPAVPPLPEVRKTRDWRTLSEGQVGELDHSILLRQYADDKIAAAVSPELKGSAYRLLEDLKQQRTVLLYASEWSSGDMAQRFFRLYRDVLKGKWKTFQVDSESPGGIAGRGDDGYFRLRCDGARVSSVEGLPTPPAISASAPIAIH